MQFVCVLEQAVYQDGDCVGKPKYKLSRSKIHKNFRARAVLAWKDYSYTAEMNADVFSFTEESQDVISTLN